MSDKVKKLFEHNVNENTVFVRCGTKVNETDPVQTKCQWTFDMGTFSQTEIYELAARSLTIDAQRKFRKGELDALATVTRDDLAGNKTRGPSKGNALKFLEGMTAEERQAFLEDNGLV